MKNFKGTTGEWKLSKSHTYGRQLVDLGELKGSIDIWYHSGDTMTKEEAVANGNLICSSKDLLLALQEMVRMYESVEPAGGWQGVYDQSVSAINKALGND